MSDQLTEIITRYDNGAIKEIKYKDSENKVQGHYKHFYKNGQICISCSYVDGKRVGKCYEFEENGNKWLDCTYNQEGKTEGTYIEWWPNGQVRMNIECRGGNFVGEFVSRWNNGNLWETCFYNDEGKRDGPYAEYSEEGKLIKEITYKNGKLVEKEIEKEVKKEVKKEVEPISIMLTGGNCIYTTTKHFFDQK